MFMYPNPDVLADRDRRETHNPVPKGALMNSYAEVICEQDTLRDCLTCLRRLAEQFHLDFGEALTESDAAYQDLLLREKRR